MRAAVKSTIRTLSNINSELSCSLGWANTYSFLYPHEVLIQQKRDAEASFRCSSSPLSMAQSQAGTPPPPAAPREPELFSAQVWVVGPATAQGVIPHAGSTGETGLLGMSITCWTATPRGSALQHVPASALVPVSHSS